MNKPHVHAELIKAWADGAEIEYFNSGTGSWRHLDRDRVIGWYTNVQYRVKPKPFEHKWKKEIEAYTLHGKTVQQREGGAEWRDFINGDEAKRYDHKPSPGKYAIGFDKSEYEFRIKPETVVVYGYAGIGAMAGFRGSGRLERGPLDNLKLTFEDGVLVDSEVLRP